MTARWLLPTIMLWSLTNAAKAHVLFADSQVSADKVQVRFIIVGEGCKAGLSTSSLTVRVPSSIPFLLPIDVPGWTTVVDKAAGKGEMTSIIPALEKADSRKGVPASADIGFASLDDSDQGAGHGYYAGDHAHGAHEL